MNIKITSEDFKKLALSRARNHKYGAIRCTRNGIKFPSKLERSYYDFLTNLKNEEKILFFLRQVGLHLPGNIKYICDFVVFNLNGQIEFIDVKGKETDVYKMKKKLVEEIYPIKIKEIRKGDF
jgi:hypothetical protein